MPSTATNVSPTTMPARSAGRPETTLATIGLPLIVVFAEPDPDRAIGGGGLVEGAHAKKDEGGDRADDQQGSEEATIHRNSSAARPLG